ncbi:hypothetical protein M0811_08912 [Anaeramoeba ignava]|uniref:BTB domain-containing protein n=1 Tax=Anaeramoeba ignava TaxID=1746090 RepID=A0A9Q0LJZ8_ANAIG|nr:hypothetical protein M0811_08912 [Anaeramoeba ignava]
MTPLDYNRRSYIPTIILKKFNSYNEDFYGIFQRQEKCDLKIHSKEGSYFVHSSMLKIRIGEDKLNKVAEVLGNRTDEEVKAFIEFIYSGNVNKKISSSVIEEICKEIGINWEEKAYKKGLLRDLKKAYDNRSSADFSIICAETRINVHSVVLLARSGLFREMFLSVNDSSNEVHDYSEKSKEAMEFFINFLYTDKLDPLMTLEKVEEIEDAVEFYRLNPDSSFDDQIEGLKTKFK